MINSVTPDMVDHYVNLLRDGHRTNPYLGNSMAWMVVRGQHHRLTITELARRLGADPATIAPCVPMNLDPDPGHVVLGQREEDVFFWAPNGWFTPRTLARVSADAQAWGFFWLVNNANGLFYAADGEVVTELNVLRPSPEECFGRDPRALDAHLGAIRALYRQKQAEDEYDEDDPGAFHELPPSPYPHDPDWETALATVEALTGVRLGLGWLTTEQPSVRASGSLG